MNTRDIHIKQPIGSSKPSLAWLLLSGLGSAIAGIVVVGIVAGRLGMPIYGGWLLGAAGLAALPQLRALLRGGWERDWRSFAAMAVGIVAVGGAGLALAWPSLLPLGLSVDAVHHTQLINWIVDHAALPAASRDMQGLLGEMSVYPVGLMLVVIAAADLVRQPALETLYPTAAILGGLIAGLVVLLASASSQLNGETEQRQPTHPARSLRGFRHSLFTFLALLAGPLILLIHRTYLLEAYIDHSYYTMVLGVFLVLLAGAWLIIPARISWFQFGLVLAALVGTYPLWAPLAAAFAAIVLLSSNRKPTLLPTEDEGRMTKPLQQTVFRLPSKLWSYFNRIVLLSITYDRVSAGVLAFGPALALALLDLVPRLKGGQAVLAHQGLVTMPTIQRLAPLMLALPAVFALLGSRRGRRLAGFAGLGLGLLLALAFAAQLGRAASYHSYKMLFVLLPIAAAILSAACLRLAGARQRVKQGLVVAGALALGFTGSFHTPPGQLIHLIDPNLVAAARWLRANQPQQATKAIAINVPNGPIAYWIQIGLLGQRRDRVEPRMATIMSARPSVESWFIDQHLPPIAIVGEFTQPLEGMDILARFGSVAVVQRTDKVDLLALHPLAIHYRTFWEHDRLKTAIEMQHPAPGALPMLEVCLYHDGALVQSFPLGPDPERTRPQYLGVDLSPQTLGGDGYVNVSDFPHFAPPATPPTGALTLTLRLSIAGNSVDERQLATMQRTSAGRFEEIATNSGELVYLRHRSESTDLRATTLDFDGALRLSGWGGPQHISADDPVTIDLRWQALRPLDRSLFPELQLLNASGQPVATNLAAPQDGFYPTWRWRPGESITEQRNFTLPQALEPGIYRLVVQVHDFSAQRILTAYQDGVQLAEIGQVVIDSPEMRRR
jgi:hypothetical protein